MGTIFNKTKNILNKWFGKNDRNNEVLFDSFPEEEEIFLGEGEILDSEQVEIDLYDLIEDGPFYSVKSILKNTTTNKFREIEVVSQDDFNHRVYAYEISYLDFQDLKNEIENISREELTENELYSLEYSVYTAVELKEKRMLVVDAGPYISDTTYTYDNVYASNCDTYGPYCFHAEFYYQPELELYIIIEKKYYAC
jgi:hypothetical protein